MPLIWKIAFVIPVHNNGSKLAISDSRPISSTSSLIEISEKFFLKFHKDFHGLFVTIIVNFFFSEELSLEKKLTIVVIRVLLKISFSLGHRSVFSQLWQIFDSWTELWTMKSLS